MKKGRHRRFEEARAMKRVSDTLFTRKPCDECGAASDEQFASWCLARVIEDEDEEDFEESDFDADSALDGNQTEPGHAPVRETINAKSLEPEDATP